MNEITVQELKEMMDNGEEFKLIDVREPHEVDIATIGGELIPMGTVMDNTDKIPEDVPVVMYCRSGGRSGSVVQALQRQFGYDNLINLEGGILAWADEIDNTITKY